MRATSTLAVAVRLWIESIGEHFACEGERLGILVCPVWTVHVGFACEFIDL